MSVRELKSSCKRAPLQSRIFEILLRIPCTQPDAANGRLVKTVYDNFFILKGRDFSSSITENTRKELRENLILAGKYGNIVRCYAVRVKSNRNSSANVHFSLDSISLGSK